MARQKLRRFHHESGGVSVTLNIPQDLLDACLAGIPKVGNPEEDMDMEEFEKLLRAVTSQTALFVSASLGIPWLATGSLYSLVTLVSGLSAEFADALKLRREQRQARLN